MTTTLTRSAYRKLIDDISHIYESTRSAVVTAYWRIGKRIVEVDQHGNARAPYGEKLLEKVSDDLMKKYGSGFSTKTLERMRGFYLQNRISTPSSKLKWSHHVELLSVPDVDARQRMAKRIEEKGLTRNDIRALIRKGKRFLKTTRTQPTTPLTVKRGVLDTCAIVDDPCVQVPRGFKMVDLGLHVKRLVRIEELKGMGVGACSYTYRGIVERVVDGDTLKVWINCGFNIHVTQTLRFRGIDTPEMDTPEGKAAKRFVERIFAHDRRIVLSTHTTDDYARYVADVWFPSSASGVMRTAQNTQRRTHDAATIAATGTYLNQYLLDSGHAVRM